MPIRTEIQRCIDEITAVDNNFGILSMSARLAQPSLTIEEVQAIGAALQNQNCKVTQVFLNNNNMGFEGARVIATALKHANCKVTEVYLGNNNIGDEGAKAIAEALKHPKCNVTEVDLYNNNIGDEGAKFIAAGLNHRNCKVTDVDLSGNYIFDEGAKKIATALKDPDCKVTYVDLSDNNIGDEGKRALKEAGWDENTDEIIRKPKVDAGKNSSFIHNAINFASKHKGKLALAGVAACTLIAYYKKPQMLTNLKGMLIGLCEKASSFVMGK